MVVTSHVNNTIDSIGHVTEGMECNSLNEEIVTNVIIQPVGWGRGVCSTSNGLIQSGWWGMAMMDVSLVREPAWFRERDCGCGVGRWSAGILEMTNEYTSCFSGLAGRAN